MLGHGGGHFLVPGLADGRQPAGAGGGARRARRGAQRATAKPNTVEFTVKLWEAVGYFALSPCGRGVAPVSSTLRTRRLVVPSPLTPTLSREERGSQKSLRPRVLLLIQRYWPKDTGGESAIRASEIEAQSDRES